MKRLLPALGALVLVVAVVAFVTWQRPDAAPPPAPSKPVVLKYADGTTMWDSDQGDAPTPLAARMLAALQAEASLSFDQARTTGATVITTIDPKAQLAATTVLESSPLDTLRYSITAIDPATGGVRVYVPGVAGQGDGVDYAGGVLKQPGATIMPFDVVAGLQSGQPLTKEFDGRSPRKIAGVEIRDDVATRCGERCTIREALLKSSNVVMYDLVANELGPRKVADAARQAGVPEAVTIDGQKKKLLVGEEGGSPYNGIALGVDSAAMRPLDLTTAYATLAAEGTYFQPHFIAKIDAGNGILYQAVEQGVPAFDPDAARSKDIATQVGSVLKEGTLCPGAVCRVGELQLPDSRQSGHAFVTGYTPKLAVTVFVGSADPAKPMQDKAGAPFGGAGLPKELWLKFAAQTG